MTRSTPRRESDPAAATAWIETLLGALGAVHAGSGTDRKWQCPAHEGNSPALNLRPGDRGAVLHCHSGCTADAVLRALRLRRAHLFHPPGTPAALWRTTWLADLTLPPMVIEHGAGAPGTGRGNGLEGYVRESEHYYGTADDPDSRVMRKVRYRHPEHGKTLRWESEEIDGAWRGGLGGRKERDLDLYLWPEVLGAVADGDTVVLAESESSVDALHAVGIAATTWAGGATGIPEPIVVARLAPLGDRVVIVPDNDDAGRAAGERLAELLPDARHVLGEPGEDARDLLARIGPDAFRALVDPVPGPEDAPAEPSNVRWLYGDAPVCEVCGGPIADRQYRGLRACGEACVRAEAEDPPDTLPACVDCGRDDTYRVDGRCPFCVRARDSVGPAPCHRCGRPRDEIGDPYGHALCDIADLDGDPIPTRQEK